MLDFSFPKMEPSGPSSLLTISRASQDRVSSQLEDEAISTSEDVQMSDA